MDSRSLESIRDDRVKSREMAIDRLEVTTNSVGRFLGRLALARRERAVRKVDRVIEARRNLPPLWEQEPHFVLLSAEAPLILASAQQTLDIVHEDTPSDLTPE